MPETVPAAVPDTVLAVLHADGPRLADPQAPLLRADDLGVLRGESVFETVRIAAGRPAFLDLHLDRLARSAGRLELALPGGWPALVELAVGAWTRPDGALRLVCTRGGVAYALVTPVPDATVRDRAGVRAVTLTYGVPARLREGAPWLLGGVKTTSYAVNMAALRQAQAMGSDEVVFLSSDGEVLEAPTATVGWVTAGRLLTPPPADVGILPGTTMAVVLRLCQELGVAADVRRGTAAELAAADEVLLASSVRGVVPVIELDGRPLGPTPVTRRLAEAFERAVLG